MVTEDMSEVKSAPKTSKVPVAWSFQKQIMKCKQEMNNMVSHREQCYEENEIV